MTLTSRNRRKSNQKKGKPVDGQTGTDAIMAAYGNKRRRQVREYRQMVASTQKDQK